MYLVFVLGVQNTILQIFEIIYNLRQKVFLVSASRERILVNVFYHVQSSHWKIPIQIKISAVNLSLDLANHVKMTLDLAVENRVGLSILLFRKCVRRNFGNGLVALVDFEVESRELLSGCL